MPNPTMIGYGKPLSFVGAPQLPFNGYPHDVITQALRNWVTFRVGRGATYQGPTAAGSGGGWVVTDVAGTGAVAGALRGGFTITTGTTDENSTQMQHTATRFYFDPPSALSGKRLIIAARVKVSTAATTGAILGIGSIDTTFWTAAAGAIDFADGLVFYKDATATDFTLTCRRAGSNHFTQACGLTITDDAYMVLVVVVTAISATQSVARVYAKMDPNDVFTTDPNAANSFLGSGTAIAAFNHNLSTGLVPTLACGQEGGTTARVLTTDWMFVAEEL